MSYLIIPFAFLALALAVLTLVASLKRRMALMTISLPLMLLFLGLEQMLTGEPRWLSYLLFSVAGLSIVTGVIRSVRAKRA
jgi:uncharacterized membrane protein YccC